MVDTPEPIFTLPRLSESEMALFAQLLAAFARPGDVIALEGEVGAGKTTFARAFIRAFLGERDEEIPSPTYSLVQTYECARMSVAHFDLYRVSDPSELLELGLDHDLADGVTLVEWPSLGEGWLPESRLELHLSDPSESGVRTVAGEREHRHLQNTRDVRVFGLGACRDRCRRLRAMYDLIVASGWWKKLTSISYLAGDASVRGYARLTAVEGQHALVMDWPHSDAGVDEQSGKTSNQISHIADNVVPFVAVANALRESGLSAPEIYAFDELNGFIVLEDFGDQVFFDEVHKGVSMSDLWQVATDALVTLREKPVPELITVSGGVVHKMPPFDRDALWSEVELLGKWYWPRVHGGDMPADMAARFQSLWNDAFETLGDEPRRWILRDYHSPNLVWLPDQTGIAQVGVIDFQDAVAGPASYDLVSLLQDARVSVPAKLEGQLLEYYCNGVLENDPGFDRTEFMYSYALMGAQRNTKILGIFARLAKRDHKPHYLAHIPRIWGYLNRDLQHPRLSELASWYEEAFDVQTRTGARPV